jgi:phage shock protein PspC (stress-responsive transcriptional regulator)
MAKKKIKKLYRAKEKDSMIGGVCAGFADYLEVDPTIIRLFWAASILFWGFGFWAYIFGWIIIPRK